MSTVFNLALKRVRKNFSKTCFSSVSVMLSSAIISAMASVSIFIFEAKGELKNIHQTAGGEVGDAVGLGAFINESLEYVSFVLIAVSVITLFSLYVYSALHSESADKFRVTLASIGATSAQCRRIMLTETTLLYVLPIIIGALLGIIPAALINALISSVLSVGKGAFAFSLAAALITALSGSLAVILLSVLPKRKKGELLYSLKRHNKEQAQAYHSYRSSYTFRHMPTEKRIAKKSTEYYKRHYRRISLMISGCTLYFVLAILFIYLFGSIDIVVDTNPYDGIDTSAMSISTINTVTAFCSSVLLVLCAAASLQVALMIRAQRRLRAETLTVYKKLGMTERGAKLVLSYETRSIIFNSILYTIIAFALLLSLLIS